jgi:hypothetical protein
MRIGRLPLLTGIAVSGCAAALLAQQPQEKKGEAPPAVGQILPRATVPADIRALATRAQTSMVFVDPVTGESRAPEPGEYEALIGAAAQRRAAPQQPTVLSVLGGEAVRPLAPEFLTAVVGDDGTVNYECSAPGHVHPTAAKGGRDAQ